MRRWQKLSGFAMAMGTITYGLHVSPASASAILIGALVPCLGIYVAGNVREHRIKAGAPPAEGQP